VFIQLCATNTGGGSFRAQFAQFIAINEKTDVLGQ